jgi:hypothetical protein
MAKQGEINMKKYSVKEVVLEDKDFQVGNKTIKGKKQVLITLATGLDWQSAKALRKEHKGSYIV